MLEVGQAVFVRTVTHHYTGRVVAVDATWITLEDVAWIADDGRFSEALSRGMLQEVEPFPAGQVLIGIGSVVDISCWTHPLPRAVK